MFTGLIAGVGRLSARELRGGDARLHIDTGSLPFDAVILGESIAVNGCCLTVVAFDAGSFAVDASNETLALTTLGTLAISAPVNLERAMLPTDRLGGHLSSHFDACGCDEALGRCPRERGAGESPRQWRFCATSRTRARSAWMASA